MLTQVTVLWCVGLMAGTFLWVRLFATVFSVLETRHPNKYEALGRPSIFQLNSWRTNKDTFCFLAHRDHVALADAALTRQSDFLVVYSVGFALWFLSLPIGLNIVFA